MFEEKMFLWQPFLQTNLLLKNVQIFLRIFNLKWHTELMNPNSEQFFWNIGKTTIKNEKLSWNSVKLKSFFKSRILFSFTRFPDLIKVSNISENGLSIKKLRDFEKKNCRANFKCYNNYTYILEWVIFSIFIETTAKFWTFNAKILGETRWKIGKLKLNKQFLNID